MGNLKLKKNQFDAIRHELLNTARTQAIIAADYQVSSTMVSVVNNVGSWTNYTKGIKAKYPLRRPVGTATTTKAQQWKVTHSSETRQGNATTKLAKDLDVLEATPTRTEFDDLSRRISIVNRKVMALTQTPFIGRMIERQIKKAISAAYRER